MRRLMLSALCAAAVAAPIPIALAQSGPEVAGETAAKLAKAHLAKAELREDARKAQVAAKRRAAQKRQQRAYEAVAVPPHLQAIAACESGGDPTAVSSNGMYHGKYQFSVETWAAVGGSGMPSQVPEAEQDMRAAMLYEQSGPGQWPVCGS